LKIKEGFMLREVAGQWIVVPLGERVVEFSGIMTLSESGAELWRKMEQSTTQKELIDTILSEYNVDEETAKEDVLEFVNKLKDKNLIEE
jgi:Coenzyme PQQ synthesis protein D (PqqD).